MSCTLSGAQKREKPTAELASSHHVFPAANKFCYPHKVLALRESELHLNVMKKLQGVTAKGIEAATGCFYEIVHTILMNS
jgi:hypothetical protein